MAIRIPFYDSQVGMSPEAAGALMPMQSVEEAGIPGMRLAKAGDQLLDASTVVNERLNHARAVKDFAAMDLQTRLGLDKLGNEIQQDPEAPPETWSKLFEEGAKKIKAEVRAMTGNGLVQANYDKMWAIHYPIKLQEITAKGNKRDAQISGSAFEEHIPQYATLYAQATDDLSRSQIKDTVDSYIIAAVKTGSISPHQGAAARLNFIPEAMKTKALADIGANPVAARAKLANYKENYPGLADGDLSSLNYQASGGVHRLQQANADNLDNQFMRATGINGDPNVQLPTQQQIYDLQKSNRLASHDAWRFDKILEGMRNNPEDKSDPNIKTRLWAGIVPDNDGRITTTREMILDPQNKLSANDRISMLKDLRATDRQDDKAVTTFEKGQLSGLKSVLGPYYDKFYDQYLKEKKTATWATQEQVSENISRIADPWLQKRRGGVFSNQPPPQPGWGTTIRNLFTGGGNASTQPPPGTMRVLNKRTGQMESVTPEQFNQIQQNQRGQR